MRALLIPANNDPATVLEIDGSLGSLQSAVGGDIQLITIRGHAINAYLNEEGKLDGSALNVRASSIAQGTGSLHDGDWIAGNMVLVGPADDEGNDTDLSEAELAWLQGLSRMA